VLDTKLGVTNLHGLLRGADSGDQRDARQGERLHVVYRARLEVRDGQIGSSFRSRELQLVDCARAEDMPGLPRAAQWQRLPEHAATVGLMLAPGRVPAVEPESGLQIPPVPVLSSVGAPAVASERPPFEVLKGLGRRLIARREQRGLTREELADRLNFPDSAVASIEHGIKPGPRTFWALADRALDADGSLLADADRSLLIWAGAVQDQLSRHHHAAARAAGPGRAMPSRAPVVDRVFADQLGAISVQARRHPEMLAAVERRRPRVERELAALTDAVRVLIRRTDFADPEIFAHVWQVLLRQDPRLAALLSAVAIVELARARLLATARF
jgi:transcriptional regulator with XRE-family HTH domain